MIIKTFNEFLNESVNQTNRLSLVNQPDGITCGPAALKMIADYYKVVVCLEELKLEMGTDDKTGTTDLKMIKGLDYISADYKQFEVGNKESAYKLMKECLATDGFVLFRTKTKGVLHWIVCDSFQNGKLHILDPWLGEYTHDEKSLDEVWAPRKWDGFAVNGIKKLKIQSSKIEKIEHRDVPEIVDFTAKIFSNVMEYEENVEYIKSATDFSRSVKLTVDDEIVGCYLVHDITLKKVPGKKGIEGVALAIKPAFRKYGLGEKLKDWLENYAKLSGYDYVYGQHLKGLSNIDYWLKRRKLLHEDKYLWHTILYV